MNGAAYTWQDSHEAFALWFEYGAGTAQAIDCIYLESACYKPYAKAIIEDLSGRSVTIQSLGNDQEGALSELSRELENRDILQGFKFLILSGPAGRDTAAPNRLSGGVEAGFIHSSTTVPSTANIAANAVVLENAVIGEFAEISANVFLDAFCVVGFGARLHRDVRVGAGTTISADADIGEGCVIGANNTIGRSVKLPAGSTLGNNVALSESHDLPVRLTGRKSRRLPVSSGKVDERLAISDFQHSTSKNVDFVTEEDRRKKQFKLYRR